MLLIMIGGVFLVVAFFTFINVFLDKETRVGYSASCALICLILTIKYMFFTHDIEIGFFQGLGIVAFLPNFVINTIICAYSIEEKYGNIALVLFFVIVPLGIKSEGMISEYRFDKFCEKNYEYKIYKKLELPRKYFHEATDKEISQSKGKLKAGDLVPNVEAIDIDVLRKNIKENRAFRQDAVYEVSFFPKKCIDEYKTLDINLNEYGRFVCGSLKFDNIADYERRYSFDVDMNNKDVLDKVVSFSYTGSFLSRFVFGSKKTKACSGNKPTFINIKSLIEFNGEE